MPRTRAGRIALLLCMLGIACLAIHASRVSVVPRYVLVQPLDLTRPNARIATVELPRIGAYELMIEARRNVPDEITREALEVVREPSPVAVGWRVTRDDATIAAGDSRDYLFVDRGPRSVAGALRRVLLRVPDGQDEVRRRTFGMLGSWTVARGIGRFHAESTGEYRLDVAVDAPWPALMPAEPRLVLRHERRLWDEAYRRSLPLAWIGLGTLGAGLLLTLMLLAGRLLGRR